MARMFPSQLPKEVIDNPVRSSEVRVYRALEKQLSNDYYVFYSSPWLGTNADGSEKDGEADFIIANAKEGILVIEVKGGRVEVDADNHWISTDRYGFTRNIKNPVNQARTSKHEIITKLKNSKKWNPRYVSAVHGVILPDVSSPDFDIRPDMPMEIFAFADDLQFLNDWIISRFRTSGQELITKLGNDGLSALEHLLASPVHFVLRLGHAIKDSEKIISDLSLEQAGVLQDLEGNRKMAIVGAAGTGKTILAVHKAVELAKKGRKTLLLCYNRPLAIHLKAVIPAIESLEIFTFDGFCQFAAEANGKIAKMDTARKAELLIENFLDSKMQPYDAVIVDEGQDFRSDWIEALDLIIKDEKYGVFYAFYDDNQNVTQSCADYISRLPLSQYRLSLNFRNSKPIFDYSSFYYKGNRLRFGGPDGIPLRWEAVKRSESILEKLKSVIGLLVKTESVSVADITILFSTSEAIKTLGCSHKIGNWNITNAEMHQQSNDKITVDSIRRFKGLESPVVILVASTELKENVELMYTAITRARSLLIMIGQPSVLSAIKMVSAQD